GTEAPTRSRAALRREAVVRHRVAVAHQAWQAGTSGFWQRTLESRQSCNRGDHQLHEYVESVRDAGSGLAGEESGRARIVGAGMGEDVACAGIESRARLPRKRRSDAVFREI